MRPERQHRPRSAPEPGAQRERAVRWLRRSYRTGAVVDAAATVGMLVPARLWMARFAPSFRRDRPEFSYGMGAGAALMAGWTLLLLWADRRPLQRKGVLPLTMVVVAGLAANDERARLAGLTSGRDLAPTRALQAGLLALFGASSGLARRAQHSSEDEMGTAASRAVLVTDARRGPGGRRRCGWRARAGRCTRPRGGQRRSPTSPASARSCRSTSPTRRRCGRRSPPSSVTRARSASWSTTPATANPGRSRPCRWSSSAASSRPTCSARCA
jgi:hypothetical protein